MITVMQSWANGFGYGFALGLLVGVIATIWVWWH